MDNLWKIFIQPERATYDTRRLDPVERELDQHTKYIRHDGYATNEYENKVHYWLFERTNPKDQSSSRRGPGLTDGNPNDRTAGGGYTSNQTVGNQTQGWQNFGNFGDQNNRVSRLCDTSVRMTCMVYIHSHGGNCLEGMHLMRVCHQLNMHLLLFDLSGHGVSEGVYSTLGLREHQDIDCLLQMVQSRFGLQTFVLWGRSMGAVAAMGYAARKPAMVRMLVLDSPFNSVEQIVRDVGGSYLKLGEYLALMMFSMIKANIKEIIGQDLGEFRPISYCDHLDVPCLFISAKDDELVRPERVQEMFANYRCVQRNLILVDGTHSSSRSILDMEKAVQYISSVLKIRPGANLEGRVHPQGPMNGQYNNQTQFYQHPEFTMRDKLLEIKGKFSEAQNGYPGTPMKQPTLDASTSKGVESHMKQQQNQESQVNLKISQEPVPQKVSNSPLLKTSRSMTNLLNSPRLNMLDSSLHQEYRNTDGKFGKTIFSPVKQNPEYFLGGGLVSPRKEEFGHRIGNSIEPLRSQQPQPSGNRSGFGLGEQKVLQLGKKLDAPDSPKKITQMLATDTWNPGAYLQALNRGTYRPMTHEAPKRVLFPESPSSKLNPLDGTLFSSKKDPTQFQDCTQNGNKFSRLNTQESAFRSAQNHIGVYSPLSQTTPVHQQDAAQMKHNDGGYNLEPQIERRNETEQKSSKPKVATRVYFSNYGSQKNQIPKPQEKAAPKSGFSQSTTGQSFSVGENSSSLLRAFQPGTEPTAPQVTHLESNYPQNQWNTPSRMSADMFSGAFDQVGYNSRPGVNQNNTYLSGGTQVPGRSGLGNQELGYQMGGHQYQDTHSRHGPPSMHNHPPPQNHRQGGNLWMNHTQDNRQGQMLVDPFASGTRWPVSANTGWQPAIQSPQFRYN